MFRVQPREVRGVVILDLYGTIRSGQPETALPREVEEIASQGSRDIVLNLARVRSRGSAGISALLAARSVAQEAASELKLLNVAAFSEDLLIGTALHTHFDVFESEELAIESFSPALESNARAVTTSTAEPLVTAAA